MSAPSPLRSAGFWLRTFVIVVAGFAVYSPAWHGDWLWDDEREIVENGLLRDWSGLFDLWIAPKTPDYFPLKSTIQWIEWHLWGDQATAYHLATIAFHVFGALLVWRVLHRLGVRLAWLAGLVFAIHPLAVESVAWISEQKNTTSLPLLLLAIDRYLAFDATRRPRDYALAALCFTAALLCKTSVVMFPAVILLHAWWKRGRIARGDVVASAPFFAISLVLGLVTVWYQHHHAIASWKVPMGGFVSQVANAGLALAFYLGKSVWPAELVPIYPRWSVDPPAALQFAPWVALGAIVLWCWRRRASWGRHALLALGFFVINLLPVLGFIKMAWMNFAPVGDHLAYIALIAPIGLGVAGLGRLMDAVRSDGILRGVAWGAVAGLGVALGWRTLDYAHVFRGQEAFCTYTLARNPAAWMAHLNLGTVQFRRGQEAEGLAHFIEAARLKPEYPEAQNNLGYAFTKLGRFQEAIAHLEEALRLKPVYAIAQCNLGHALMSAGRAGEAVGHFEESLRLRPTLAEAEWGLGSALVQLGKLREAAAHYEKALLIDDRQPQAHAGLAEVLALAGEEDAAIRRYTEALRLSPASPEWHYNLANLLLKRGRAAEAVEHYREALRVKPGYVEAMVNLANALAETGQRADAIAWLRAALERQPDNGDAHTNLGSLLAEGGDVAAALPHFETAARLAPGSAAAQTNFGTALLFYGRVAEAKARFEAALRLEPGIAAAREMLTRIETAEKGGR